MPPNNTPEPFQQTNNNRKRGVSDRVVPAIPLALSRPKRPKPKQPTDQDGKVQEDGVTDYVGNTDISNSQQAPNGVLNRSDQLLSKNPMDQSSALSERAVIMPSTGTPRSQGSAALSLSNGATPELSTPASGRQSTPPRAQEAQQTPEVASPESRKPTDPFDMRHIRTELPPAFIPSAEQHTPRSTGSSHSNRASVLPHGHPVHPSASSIVFGGQDSSASSPVPPHSAGSAFIPPQYPPFGNPQQPTSASQGHAHHASEPHGQRIYQPQYPQSAMPWNMRHNYGQAVQPMSYFHPHGHMPFRELPREGYVPSETRHANGGTTRSRSTSQASSSARDQQKPAQPLQSPTSPEAPSDSVRSIYQEPKSAFPRYSYPRPQPFHPQMQPPPFYPPPDVNADLENAQALRSHVQSQFSNPALADCHLEITEGNDGSHQHIAGHKIIFSRSSTLSNLIQATETPSSDANGMGIQVLLDSRYLHMTAFTNALKYLYGGPLLQLDYHRPSSSAGERVPANIERMDHALQYIAAGVWLKVAAIASRGVEVAGSVLHWDTIATALTFALDGGLSPIWTVDDGSEDRVSTSSSDDSLSRPEHTATPTFDPYSTHLLQRIIVFVVHMFPPNFFLDAQAPQISTCPRLPPLPPGQESRPRSDPRLSQIRFGEIPVEDHHIPSFATSTLSGVLLSLPFPVLKWVLEHYDLAAKLGPETVASIMRQVVAERETRRTKVLKARIAGAMEDVSDPQLAQNVLWEESVEPSAQHRAGFRLTRRKRGIETPPSSGACSD